VLLLFSVLLDRRIYADTFMRTKKLQRFPAPPVPGIPPHPMFRPAPQHNVSPPPPSSKHPGLPQIQLDAQPVSSTELSEFLDICKQLATINDEVRDNIWF